MQLDQGPFLRRLKELAHTPAAMLDDSELNAALDPFRGRLPVKVVCGARRCRMKVAWWGLPVPGEPGWQPLRRRVLPTPASFVPKRTRIVRQTGYVYGVVPWSVSGALVIQTTNGPRKEHLWKGPRIPPESLRLQPPFPYNVWSVQRTLPPRVEPAGAEGGDIRYHLTCKSKTTPHVYTITNATMLRYLVRALENGWALIALPEGLQPSL